MDLVSFGVKLEANVPLSAKQGALHVPFVGSTCGGGHTKQQRLSSLPIFSILCSPLFCSHRHEWLHSGDRGCHSETPCKTECLEPPLAMPLVGIAAAAAAAAYIQRRHADSC